ncbi:MAG: hypothetical protein ACC669_08845, partial [bacterium]
FAFATPLSFASGPFTGTLDGYMYIRAGILVNHEAKLKGVAKASDYTQKPGHMNTPYRYSTN